MSDDPRFAWLAGRRALITGGLGFIGSNLARRLVDLGAIVTVVDSLIPEYGGNAFNLDGIESRIQVKVSDIRDVYSEAKGVGYDIKTMRKIVSLRKLDAADRAEQETLLDTYKHALGMA